MEMLVCKKKLLVSDPSSRHAFINVSYVYCFFCVCIFLGSGKSSLLHILGNQTLGSTAELKGTIYHDDKDVEDVPLLPWQRCAFIEALDEHFRDLSVLDILTYAMLLRTDEKLPEEELKSNVNNALELLQLEEYVPSYHCLIPCLTVDAYFLICLFSCLNGTILFFITTAHLCCPLLMTI